MLAPVQSLEKLGIGDLHVLFQNKKLSPVEYTQFVLSQAERYHHLNLFVTLLTERALEDAAASEKRYMKGTPLGELDGVPIAIKDIFDVEGVPTTQGCSYYKNDVAKADAFSVRLLREKGVVFPGKANTSQFALGPMGDVSHIGACRNPHDPERVTGGSSSGSAASVAALVVPGALGTDTGGSIRMPASLCGVVGMKTTYSLVSNMGVKPLSFVLDTIGPLTRTVKDNAILLNAITENNPLDWRNARKTREDYTGEIGKSIQGLSVAYSEAWNQDDVQPEISDAIHQCLKVLKEKGAKLKPVAPPDLSEIRAAHQLVMCAGGHAVHVEDIKRNNGDVFEQVMKRLLSGNVSSDQYIQCLEERVELIRILFELMGEASAILLPSTPMTANRIQDETVTFSGKSHVPITTHPRFTWIANFSGFPCLSVPVGFDKNGLPMGVSLIGKPFQEAVLYQIASHIEGMNTL